MKKSSVRGLLRRYFAMGLVSLLPTIVVAYILYFAFGKLKRATTWILGFVSLETYWWGEALFTAIFLLLGATFIIIVGAISTTLVGRGVVRIWDRVIIRIPILSRVYVAVQQVSAALSLRHKQVFKSVVLVQYPHKGMFRIGFITSDGLPDLLQGQEALTVFVPSTPNPMGGFLFVTTPDQVLPVDMAVEEAIKMVISGGFVTPNQTRGLRGGEAARFRDSTETE